VAIHKDSARRTASETLTEAAEAKRLKYKSLGAFFHPLVISAGGLMEKDTAKSYKAIQKLVGPTAASYMDTSIGLALTRSRALAAAFIARLTPRRK